MATGRAQAPRKPRWRLGGADRHRQGGGGGHGDRRRKSQAAARAHQGPQRAKGTRSGVEGGCTSAGSIVLQTPLILLLGTVRSDLPPSPRTHVIQTASLDRLRVWSTGRGRSSDSGP